MRYNDMDNARAESAPEAPALLPQEAVPAVEAEPLRYAEPPLEHMNLSILQNNLGNCLGIIDNEVMKGYVTRLEEMPLIIREEEDFSQLNDIHFFKISELVYQEDEFSVDKLAMVFQALSNKPCTLVMMLKSDGEKTDFYLGARPNGTNSAGTLFQMLKNSLIGFFPGSKISEYYDEDMKKDMQKLNVGCVSEVTCVADYKQQQDTARTNKEFIQGLEKFVYAMRGKSYTAVLIADNLSYEELMARKREYERIYTQISPFANMQMNFTLSEGTSKSEGNSSGKTSGTSTSQADSITNSTTDTDTTTAGSGESVTITDTTNSSHTDSQSKSQGKTHTTGHSDSEGKTVTNSVNVSKSTGMSLGYQGVGINRSVSKSFGHSTSKSETHTDSVSDSISKTLTRGFSDTTGTSHSAGNTISSNKSRSESKSVGRSIGKTDTITNSESFTYTDTLTLTENLGSSKGLTLNSQNMTLALVLEKIRKHLERIEECESIGMWNFAAYFLGSSTAEAETASNTYKSVVAGTDSGIERSAINSWNDGENVHGLMNYIAHFVHPQFLCTRFDSDGEQDIIVDPASLVSTSELAIHMGLPRHSVVGLPVAEHAAFGKEVISAGKSDDKKIPLGTVYDMGLTSQTEIGLDLNSLTMHTFVTGSTGSGKSNAVYHLLSEARRKGVPFLVVEPAKGEYKTVFPDVKCYGTNPLEDELLRIDPFAFPEGIHVLEHIDRIVEIFNVCWPMYAAMPAVLKESIVNAYKAAGWDLDYSRNDKVEGLFPTFDDVLRELNYTIKHSDYSSDTKGDYIGALSTRLKSLTNGINGLIFTCDEIDRDRLFNNNAIIDISRVGSVETKSLIMGLMVMKLQEYRMAKTTGMNLPLKHLTVLEEAHNLLKKTSTEQSADSANLAGKSVEMLTNAIAEIRTYGEGFIIVDQAPNLLDTAVIRNTNTKIVLRLPESTDREITGSSIALKDNQFEELSKLPTGVAAVYQNDWQEAVLCALPRFKSSTVVVRKPENGDVNKRGEIDSLLRLLIADGIPEPELDRVKSEILKSNLSAAARKDLILNLNRKTRAYEWAAADFINKNYTIPEDIFRGYNAESCKDLGQLAEILTENLRGEFQGFSDEELVRVLYYVCHILHERYPAWKDVETLRVDYLKERALKWK